MSFSVEQNIFQFLPEFWPTETIQEEVGSTVYCRHQNGTVEEQAELGQSFIIDI